MIFFLFNFFLAVQPSLSQSGSQDPADLNSITFQKIDGELRVIIGISGKFSDESLELDSPNRLVLDFWPVKNIFPSPVIPVNECGIRQIRVGRFKPETARVVFDFIAETPSFKIIRSAEGMEVTFRMAEVAVREEGQEKAAVKEARQEEKEEIKTPREEMPPEFESSQNSFFIQVNSGMVIFVKTPASSQVEFTLYEEKGSIQETYDLKGSFSFDLNFGRTFPLGKRMLKAGLGISFVPFKHSGSFEVSLPHPYTPNMPRTLTFEETFNKSFFHIYVFGLFNFFEKEKFQAGLGPLLGFVKGKFISLEDIDVEDKAPFTSADVSLKTKTFAEDSFSSISAGGMLNLGYSLTPNFSLNLSSKFIFLNPKITNLAKRVNLSQSYISIALQYNF